MTEITNDAKINSKETSEENSQRRKFAIERNLSLKKERIEKFIDYFENDMIERHVVESDVNRRDRDEADYVFQLTC